MSRLPAPWGHRLTAEVRGTGCPAPAAPLLGRVTSSSPSCPPSPGGAGRWQCCRRCCRHARGCPAVRTGAVPGAGTHGVAPPGSGQERTGAGGRGGAGEEEGGEEETEEEGDCVPQEWPCPPTACPQLLSLGPAASPGRSRPGALGCAPARRGCGWGSVPLCRAPAHSSLWFPEAERPEETRKIGTRAAKPAGGGAGGCPCPLLTPGRARLREAAASAARGCRLTAAVSLQSSLLSSSTAGPGHPQSSNAEEGEAEPGPSPSLCPADSAESSGEERGGHGARAEQMEVRAPGAGLRCAWAGGSDPSPACAPGLPRTSWT